MPFPTILHCLVCEDLRAEQRNLITLAGFYGILPNVEIISAKIPGIARLGFLFVGGSSAVGKYQLVVRVLGPDGSVVVESPSQEANIDASKPNTNIGFTLGGVSLPSEGKYTIELLVDKSLVYSAKFTVRRALSSEIPGT